MSSAVRRLFSLLLVAVALVARADVAHAQTVLLLRTATDRGNYHYAEVYQERGRWIVADVGYIDFNHPGDYREVFFGAGGEVVHTARLTVLEEGLIDKANGSASRGDVFFLPYTYIAYRVTSRVSADAVYFPYLPLTSGGRVQHLLERAKVEYDFAHVKFGGGYAAYRFGDEPWSHKPFVTTTLKAGRFGSFEVWLQRLAENHVTVQLRYANSFR
jgi:hypothetical protein